ncbi:type IV pilus modification protein PilV [Dyella tabacisoli]|uniref:Type IV pilus modification protein PilV n=1 Tax=Dyella tabacisoli TaxID=2282381 RepID=A0A369UHI1_9GAMM|nr:type IV pilus modification protein PilV [Dyella tabacisoli]RDD79937.1 type IV pilus modification protein PilV [Dyella tabacisoli]
MLVVSHQRGISLIEVLVAVLIFSIGLIGLAGLMVMAARSNQAAYLRTQATFLAGNMADRMRANPVGVWSGSYNASYSSVSNQQVCNASSACSPDQVAARDQHVWGTMLSATLPDAVASISCDKSSVGFALSPDQINMRPPYGGSCAMTIRWVERKAGDKNHRDADWQTYAWEFQP